MLILIIFDSYQWTKLEASSVSNLSFFFLTASLTANMDADYLGTGVLYDIRMDNIKEKEKLFGLTRKFTIFQALFSHRNQHSSLVIF